MKGNKNPKLLMAAMICLYGGLSIQQAQAQDQTDALRYSYLSTQGTARSIGFGNALGSIGGDFSALSVNPAGIGIYRRSEFTFTPSIKINSVNSTYQGNSTSASSTRFSISNLGLVLTSAPKGKRYKNSNWKAVSFGMGITRVADFNRSYNYNGPNSGNGSSSMTERFVIDANNYPAHTTGDQWRGTPGWFGYQSYLIDYDSTQKQYYTNVPWQAGINQSKIIKEHGGITEVAFSLGGNYQEKLMLGATVGIPVIRYTRESTYSERTLNDDESLVFRSFDYKESLRTTGTGLNLKLGFIYAITDYVRVGAAFHTPTIYGVTESYDQSLLADTKGYALGGDRTLKAPNNVFDYTLITPWRGVLSASAIIGKYGFISADYEYVNYRSMNYVMGSDYAQYESEVNDAIKNSYRGASNFRIGGELNLSPLMVRLGFGYMGSPYKDYSDADRLDFSAGLGFRFDNAFIDLGFIHSQYKGTEQPYTLSYQNVTVPSATLSNSLNNVAITIGFKF